MREEVIILGDIHNRWYDAENICVKYPNVLKVFVGDYFDSFDDNSEVATDTAMWLKQSLRDPRRVHLLGNHDFQYLTQGKHVCSGFSHDKNLAINDVIKLEDWNLIKPYYKHNNWLISHAGFTLHWFDHPVFGFTIDNIDNVLKKAYQSIHTQTNAILPLWAADHYRGGRFMKGGLLWNDWRNCDFIPGYNQIFGHTHVDKIKYRTRKRKTFSSININVDCGLAEYLVLTDNKIIVRGKNEREIPNV